MAEQERTPGARAELSKPVRHAIEVTVSFGEAVLDIRHLLPPKALVIGEGKSADLFVSSDGLPASEFPLLRWEHGKCILTFAAEQRGEVAVGGAIHPVQWFKTHPGVVPDPAYAHCYRYVFGLQAEATLRFDGLSIMMRHVTAPERLVENPTKRDLRYGAAIIGSSILVLACLIAFLVVGGSPEQVAPAEIPLVEQRMARLLVAPATGIFSVAPSPSVKLPRTPVVLGLLSRADTEAALAQKGEEISRCLSFAKTTAQADLEVDADGSAFVAAVRGADAAANGCLLGALQGLHFPPPLDARADVRVDLSR